MEDIIRTINSMGLYTDAHKWDNLTDVFSDKIALDYTALTGGEPSTVTKADLIASWKATVGRLEATQHIISNHLVTIKDAQADVEAYFQATHLFKKVRWVLGGKYTIKLAKEELGWKIIALTMTPIWQTGDATIVQQAQNEPASNR